MGTEREKRIVPQCSDEISLIDWVKIEIVSDGEYQISDAEEIVLLDK